MGEAIRQSELVGRGLMSYETTEEVGNVEHLLVDVKRSHDVGINYKSLGLIARKQSVSWQSLVKIGGDRTLIRTESASDEAELAAGQNMTGLEIWTDGGDRIGALVDLRLDRASGQVQQYLFSLEHEQTARANFEPANSEQANSDSAESTKPASGPDEFEPVMVYAIEPQMIISAGRKRMMIAEEDARRAQSNGGELMARSFAAAPAARPPSGLPADLPKDVGTLFQQGKTFAGKATQQAKARAKQFTEERLANQEFVDAESLPDITEQLQAKTAQAKQQIQQQLSKAAERAEQARDQMDGRLGQSPFGRSPLGKSFGKSLGNSFNQALDKLKRPSETNADSIDVDAFEVWEDD